MEVTTAPTTAAPVAHAHAPIADLASRLYPPAAAPVAAPAPTPAPADARQALADRLYGPKPAPLTDTAPNAEVQALRDSEPARLMYRDEVQLGQPLIDVIRASAPPDATSEQLHAAAVHMGAMFTDLGLGRDDVAMLAGAARKIASEPKQTEDQQRASQREAAVALRARWGAQFDTVLADAKALCTRDPRFKHYLEATGLGNHVPTVLRMAELARQQRASGRLRSPSPATTTT